MASAYPQAIIINFKRTRVLGEIIVMKRIVLRTAVVTTMAFGLFGMGNLALPNDSNPIVVQAKSVKVSRTQFKKDMAATKRAVTASGIKGIQKDYRTHGFKLMESKPSTAYDAPDARGNYCISNLTDEFLKSASEIHDEAGAVGVTDAQINKRIKAIVDAEAILYQQFRSRLSSKWQAKVDTELAKIRKGGVYFNEDINSKTESLVQGFIYDSGEAIDDYSNHITVVAGDDGTGIYNPKTGKDVHPKNTKQSKKLSKSKHVRLNSNFLY